MHTPAADRQEHGPWRLNVLNAGGRDPEQNFAGGAGNPGDLKAAHPPINHHAFAACTGGTFQARAVAAIATKRPVLLLLRRDLAVSLRVLRRLRAAGCVVVVTFKEAGAVQMAARLNNAADLRLLRSILEIANGFLATTMQSHAFLSSLLPSGDGARRGSGAFIPTPYPVDDSRWDFSRPVAERRGIFIGTREFAVPSRQHLAAVLAGRDLHRLTGEPVAVINTEGRKGSRLLAELGYSAAPTAALRVVEGPLGYVEYLREMARHRLVFQLDRSGVPGQVAGDALLCRLPCVGGDGTVEQIAFAPLAGQVETPAGLSKIAASLLSDPTRYEQACREGEARAWESLSFGVIAARLETFFRSLDGGSAETREEV